MRFYSVVSRKTLWHNKTAAVAKNNTLSAKYRTSKFIFFWWCVVSSFISALASSRSFANWIVIAWNACTHNASFVLKYTSEIKYIYATSFAHVQTIRPSALVFKYRNTHIRSTRSQYFACYAWLPEYYSNHLHFSNRNSNTTTCIQFQWTNTCRTLSFFHSEIGIEPRDQIGFRTNLIFIYALRRMMSFTIIFKRYECVDIMWTLDIF